MVLHVTQDGYIWVSEAVCCQGNMCVCEVNLFFVC